MVQKKIYYLRAASMDDRHKLMDLLDVHYQYIEATGSQAIYKPDGDFDGFKQLVEAFAYIHNLDLLEVSHIDDPGLGLFD